MAAKFDALQAPPLALEQGGTEVLRAAIVGDQLQVALRRAFDEPDVWGMLLADVARHAARIYAVEANLDEATALERICAMLQAELDSPTDHGATNAIS